MSQNQIVALISVSFLIISYVIVALVWRSWTLKHQLYYVVYRTADTHLKWCVEFFRSKESMQKWILSYGPHFTLFGVYTLVPSAYLKEYGGFYGRSK